MLNYEINEWQVQEIAAGISEAEDGRLVGHEKVKATWEAKLANPPYPSTS